MGLLACLELAWDCTMQGARIAHGIAKKSSPRSQLESTMLNQVDGGDESKNSSNNSTQCRITNFLLSLTNKLFFVRPGCCMAECLVMPRVHSTQRLE